MPSLFNLIRAGIYGMLLNIYLHQDLLLLALGTVFLFTLICLAMAGHFQHVLAASDLSKHLVILSIYIVTYYAFPARFVPFAIFVCSASMLIILVL